MATQVAQLTLDESALCTVLRDLMHKGPMPSRRIGKVFGLSEHTVRSLVCTRRRPGPVVLERLEEGCVRLLLEAKSPEARRVWWHLLDATVRCRLFPMRDPVGRLREMLKRDVDDVAAPEDFYGVRPEVWEVFEAGGAPTQDLLEATVRSYRRESESLIGEGQWEEALGCRGVALVADEVIKGAG